MEYTKKQDPHLLITGIYDASFGVYNNMIISMSPDAYVTAVAMGRSLGIFNTENGNLEELLEEVHGGNTGAVLPSCLVLWYLILYWPSWGIIERHC